MGKGDAGEEQHPHGPDVVPPVHEIRLPGGVHAEGDGGRTGAGEVRFDLHNSGIVTTLADLPQPFDDPED